MGHIRPHYTAQEAKRLRGEIRKVIETRLARGVEFSLGEIQAEVQRQMALTAEANWQIYETLRCMKLKGLVTLSGRRRWSIPIADRDLPLLRPKGRRPEWFERLGPKDWVVVESPQGPRYFTRETVEPEENVLDIWLGQCWGTTESEEPHPGVEVVAARIGRDDAWVQKLGELQEGDVVVGKPVKPPVGAEGVWVDCGLSRSRMPASGYGKTWALGAARMDPRYLDALPPQCVMVGGVLTEKPKTPQPGTEMRSIVMTQANWDRFDQLIRLSAETGINLQDFIATAFQDVLQFAPMFRFTLHQDAPHHG
jgi:hypothetical protein